MDSSTALHIVSGALGVIALVGLWKTTRGDRVVSAIVAAGLLARAGIGLALFAISLRQLPVATSLQLGDGYWSFAQDSMLYVDYATTLKGPLAIVLADPRLPSVFYIQVLAAGMALLGNGVIAGLFINLLSYAATCALITRWARLVSLPHRALLTIVVAISFFPSWILWATQPLKDTMFVFLMVWFSYLVARWTDAPADRRWRHYAGELLSAAMILYALGSIRWYIAVIVTFGAVAVWLMSIGLNPRWRRSRALALAAFTAIALVVVPVAAASSLPLFGQRLLRPRTVTDLTQVPSAAARYMDDRRVGSSRSDANTMIRSGRQRATPSARNPPATATTARRPAAPGSGPQGPVRALQPTSSMSREEALAQLASESMFERIFPRAVTMFIPTAIGHALGWVEVGGAPMFLAIADADTLFFDIVLMVIGWSLWSNWRQGGHVRPSFPYFLLTSLPLAIALCYQTANFGTQFRLRSMVAIGLLLLPFASAPPRVAARQAAHE